MIQVELSKIIIDEKRQDQIIVLKEKKSDRQFPIVIGILEASSIKMKLAGITPPRPMTHDLLLSVIEGLDATVVSLVIDDMQNNTFHGKLNLLTHDGVEKTIDCRPSDGIALAVRCGALIYVDEAVIEKAAIFKKK